MAGGCQSWERGYAADMMPTQTRKLFWPGSYANFLQPQKTKPCYLTFNQNEKFSNIAAHSVILSNANRLYGESRGVFAV